MYKDIPISERLDRIGELLAKGVYLCLKKEEKLSEEKAIQSKVKVLSSIEDEKNK